MAKRHMKRWSISLIIREMQTKSTDITWDRSEWPSSKYLQIINYRRGCGKKGALLHDVELKILQARLQQYKNRDLPDVQAGFRKGRGADSLEMILMLGKTEGRSRGWQRVRWLDGIIDLTDMTPGIGDGQGSLACCSPWGHRVRLNLATELNWTCTIGGNAYW